jgi:hypothetical protein
VLVVVVVVVAVVAVAPLLIAQGRGDVCVTNLHVGDHLCRKAHSLATILSTHTYPHKHSTHHRSAQPAHTAVRGKSCCKHCEPLHPRHPSIAMRVSQTYFSRCDKQLAPFHDVSTINAAPSSMQYTHDGLPRGSNHRSCEPHSGWRGAQTHLLGVRHCDLLLCNVREEERVRRKGVEKVLSGEGITRWEGGSEVAGGVLCVVGRTCELS